MRGAGARSGEGGTALAEGLPVGVIAWGAFLFSSESGLRWKRNGYSSTCNFQRGPTWECRLNVHWHLTLSVCALHQHYRVRFYSLRGSDVLEHALSDAAVAVLLSLNLAFYKFPMNSWKISSGGCSLRHDFCQQASCWNPVLLDEPLHHVLRNGHSCHVPSAHTTSTVCDRIRHHHFKNLYSSPPDCSNLRCAGYDSLYGGGGIHLPCTQRAHFQSRWWIAVLFSPINVQVSGPLGTQRVVIIVQIIP